MKSSAPFKRILIGFVTLNYSMWRVLFGWTDFKNKQSFRIAISKRCRMFWRFGYCLVLDIFTSCEIGFEYFTAGTRRRPSRYKLYITWRNFQCLLHVPVKLQWLDPQVLHCFYYSSPQKVAREQDITASARPASHWWIKRARLVYAEPWTNHHIYH